MRAWYVIHEIEGPRTLLPSFHGLHDRYSTVNLFPVSLVPMPECQALGNHQLVQRMNVIRLANVNQNRLTSLGRVNAFLMTQISPSQRRIGVLALVVGKLAIVERELALEALPPLANHRADRGGILAGTTCIRATLVPNRATDRIRIQRNNQGIVQQLGTLFTSALNAGRSGRLQLGISQGRIGFNAHRPAILKCTSAAETTWTGNARILLSRPNAMQFMLCRRQPCHLHKGADMIAATAVECLLPSRHLPSIYVATGAPNCPRLIESPTSPAVQSH